MLDFDQPLNNVRRNNIFNSPSYNLVSLTTSKGLQRLVPTHDATRIVLYDDSDVDRLNNVLAEILKTLKILGLLLKRMVETRIFNRNSDIIRHRFQNLEILARQVVTILRPSQREIGDNPVFDATRNEV